jgi:hypothetical protein
LAALESARSGEAWLAIATPARYRRPAARHRIGFPQDPNHLLFRKPCLLHRFLLPGESHHPKNRMVRKSPGRSELDLVEEPRRPTLATDLGMAQETFLEQGVEQGRGQRLPHNCPSKKDRSIDIWPFRGCRWLGVARAAAL